MGLTNVKKELNKLSKDKLIELIAELYKKNKFTQQFFDFYTEPNEKELFTKYYDKVYESFYPKRGFNLKLKDGKQAISDFKKLGPSSIFIADLLLFYVETGVKFTNDYGDINEAFYTSMETTYISALKLMKKENLLNDFAVRTKMIVYDTINMGWGFHDSLSDIYSDFYND